MSTYTIPLPWPKPPLTGNRTRGNPYARANEVKQAKDQAIVAVARVARRPLDAAEVTLHFRPKDKRRRDADGLAPTLKVCLDALVLQGVLPDDSWAHVPAVSCRIHPPNGTAAAMWLEVDSIGGLWFCDLCGDGYHGDPPDACWHGTTTCDDCACTDCGIEERRP